MNQHNADSAPKFEGAGTYENRLGAVMVVEQYAGAGALNLSVLGDIYIAHAPDDLFGPRRWLVTPEGMESAGYVLRSTPVTRDGEASR